MSGGVDSAAACVLLRSRGFEVGGGTMLLRSGGEQEARSAEEAARQMDIPFHLFDLREEFVQNVIAPFTRVYQDGGTPNPCIFCNNTMKFGLLLERALALGYDGIATGHYARVERAAESGRYLLKTAADGAKDQTYMLYGLSQRQLARTCFPLGDMRSKQAVRDLAQQAGLRLAQKHDSQDICFVPDGDYMGYLMAHGLTPQAGNFLSPEGKTLGQHRGVEAYTIGQRRGLQLACGSRVYVVDKRGADVVVGQESLLYSRRVFVKDVNWIPFAQLTAPLRVQAKLRYSHKTAAATLSASDCGCELLFDEPQRAVTNGQAAVFYDGDCVVGGGTICGTE
jgi:tRNA-specific 2-thiouridylase